MGLNKYLDCDESATHRPDILIISGCSGGGKSTLLDALARRRYPIIPEPGRQIVQEQVAIGGPALPKENLNLFLELALSRNIYNYLITPHSANITFADRSIIDTIPHCEEYSEYFAKAAQKFRYNQTVFFVPPWKDIFKNDDERKHDFHEALEEYKRLVTNYKNFGYKMEEIPKMSIDKRVEFVLKKLKMQMQNSGKII